MLHQPTYSWARGYCFDASDNVIVDDAIVDHILNGIRAGAELSTVINRLNGHFAIMLYFEAEKLLICCIDRYGTIPLFYHISGDKLLVADRPVEVARTAGLTSVNPSAVAEIIRLGYVTGFKTLIEGVEEIPFASISRFKYTNTGWKVATERFWAYGLQHASRRPVQVVKDQAVEILKTVAHRYAVAIQAFCGRAAVSLSGGVDSRLLVALLQDNLSAVVSYGDPESEEVGIATQVARAVDLPHHVVPTHRYQQFLDRDLLQEAVSDIGATAHFNCGIGVRIVARQEYPLEVWLPGHTGLVAGGVIDRGSLLVRSKDDAIRLISDNHTLIGDDLVARLVPEAGRAEFWYQSLDEQLFFTPRDPIGSLERWNCEQRQRRMIFTDLRAYETMGRWLLPLLDNDLVDFLCSLQIRFRYKKRLYIDTLIEQIFVGDSAGLNRIPRAGKGDLQPVRHSLKDQLALANLPRPIAKKLLDRGSETKTRLRNAACGPPSPHPNEPDPIARWWFCSPDFRQEFVGGLAGWDGAGGIVDAAEVQALLRSDAVPCNFVKYAVPSLLTVRHLQAMLTKEGQEDL